MPMLWNKAVTSKTLRTDVHVRALAGRRKRSSTATISMENEHGRKLFLVLDDLGCYE